MQAVVLNADHRLPALVHGAAEPWHASPLPGVERVLLERDGGEVARATSIVRYRPGSRFTAHVHDAGEEYLVLEGCFSDETGHHPAGSYVRNPPGSRHAPYSDGGCTIFVKLRQMRPDDSARVCVEPVAWAPAAGGGQQALLFEDAHERVSLQRVEPGACLATPWGDGGGELFVLEGALVGDDGRTLKAWSWLREPGALRTRWRAESLAIVWTKALAGR